MAVTRPLTLDDFLLLPEEQPALEYERGEITQKMSPMSWHGTLQGDLYFRFRMHGYPRKVVRAYTETRVIWPSEGISYVPDVIAYRRGRVPVGEDRQIVQRLTIPPDVAVEIASPGQALSQQMDRCRWYVQHGVTVSLLVHPERRTVWTFRAGAESVPLQGADIIELDDAIPGFSLTVDDLFSELAEDEE